MHGGRASPCPYTKPGSVALDAFEPYNQGWKTRNRHKMSIGLGKYWACTLCMYFRKKCWVFYHPLDFCEAFLTSIQICLFGSNLRLPVAIRWGNQDGGDVSVSVSFAWGWDHCCWAACGCLKKGTAWLYPGLLLDWVGLQNQSWQIDKNNMFVTRGHKHLKIWRNEFPGFCLDVQARAIKEGEDVLNRQIA